MDDVRAGLLPEEKIAAVETLVVKFGTVAMVGDGVNDAQPCRGRAWRGDRGGYGRGHRDGGCCAHVRRPGQSPVADPPQPPIPGRRYSSFSTVYDC